MIENNKPNRAIDPLGNLGRDVNGIYAGVVGEGSDPTFTLTADEYSSDCGIALAGIAGDKSKIVNKAAEEQKKVIEKFKKAANDELKIKL